MVLTALSVYDEKARFFDLPFYSLTNGEGMRLFEDAVNDSQTRLFLHPEDYKLYQIGSFDNSTGLLVSLDVPLLLCSASQFKRDVSAALTAE